MKPSREEELFDAALAKAPGERALFLDGACHGDAGLRRRLDALLAVPDQGETLLVPHGGAARPVIGPEFIELPDEAVGQMVGRYKLLERVGEGGCGVVYVAEQTEPVRRRVALKVIKLGMDTKQVVARFEAERQALAMMDHPNIAKVLDAGTTGQGKPYFVMELVRGIRITDYCDQADLTTRERIDLFIKVCQAIQHAHQKGIIHRDIKPSNILVTLHDGVPVPKVIDFGIAKATEGRLTDATVYTQLNQFIGTPAYMSPEQAEMSGLDIDTRSDIYSLGVLLYELLAGSTPFDANELVGLGIDAMRKVIREKEPVRPSTRLTQIVAAGMTRGKRGDAQPSASAASPASASASASASSRRRLQELVHQLRGDLDWIVMKCLEKDRTRRYETANGLAADLKRHLNNEPVVARPPSAAYRLQKAFRRNKLAFTSATVVVAAALAGITAIVVVQRNANAKLADTNIALGSARRKISEQLTVSQRSQAELTFHKGRELAERGDVIEGLFWMLESLKVVPGEMVDFQRLIRLNLASWTQSVARFERGWPGSARAASFAFSPDGASVLLGFKDGSLRHLDLAKGRDLHPPQLFPDRMVAAIEFHPDGRTFAIGLAGDGDRSSKDGSKASTFDSPSDALIWEVANWSQLGQPMPHAGGVHNVRFNRDGTRLLTREYPGTTLRLWDPASSQPVGEPWVVDRHQIGEDVEFSPDGTQIRLRMQQPGQSRIVTADGFRPAGVPVVGNGWLHPFHPDGSSVLVGRPGRLVGTELRLVDPASGVPREFQLDLPSGVESSRFNPSGRELFVVGQDETVHGWDVFTGHSLGAVVPEGQVRWAAPDRESRFILTAQGQWRLPRLPSRPSAPIEHAVSGGSEIRFGRASRTAVAYSAGGLRVLTRSDRPHPGTTAARLWDATTGQPVGIPLRTTGNILSDVALSPDGSIAATCSVADPGLWEFNVGGVELWDARTGRRRFNPLSPSSPIAVLDFSPDGRLLAGGAYDGKVHFWDTRTGVESGEPLSHPEIVFSLTFSPDGTKIAAGTTHARTGFPHARIWDVATRRPLFDPLGGFNEEWVLFLEFTPDSHRLLVGTPARSTVWDVTTGKAVFAQPRSAQRIYAQRLSPDGRFIATGDQNGVIRLLHTETGGPFGRPMQHGRPIQCLAFSPDGRMLATGSTAGTVRLWDLQTFEPVCMPFTHKFPVFGVTFTADGKSVVSTDAGGRSRVWPLPEPARGTVGELSVALETRTLHHMEQGVVRMLTRAEMEGSGTGDPGLNNAEIRLDTPMTDESWHRARAADAEDDRDWFGALWHLDRLIASERTDWMLRARHGRARVARGELEAAASDFEDATRLANTSGDGEALQSGLQNLAYEAREDRQWPAAVWLLDRALTGSPGDWQLLADRSEAQEQLGRHDRAQADFARALELSAERAAIPDLATQWVSTGKWSDLTEEYTRIEKVGWLFLEDWRRYALAQLKAGDSAGYRRTCTHLLDRIGTAAVPETVAGVVRRVCAVGPCSEADSARAAVLPVGKPRSPKSLPAGSDVWDEIEARLHPVASRDSAR